MPLIDATPDAIAQTYAKSLFELAEAEGGQSRAEDVLGELEAVLEVARGDARFSEFLSSRVLPAAKRRASIESIFTDRASPLVLRFLLVLNEKDRLAHLPPITAAYDTIIQDRFGRVEVDVYSAAPLASEELDAVRDRLGSALGKEVIVHPYTDESLIGGIRLQIGDQLIDGSVATRLRRMGERLAADGASRIRERFDSAVDDA